MNKKILLTLAFVLVITLSMGTIYASEVNVTDSYSSGYDVPLGIGDEESQSMEYDSDVDNVLESESSNSLSTNADSNILGDNSTIDISKTVTSKDVTKYYKGSAKYTATFLNATGSPLANTNVKIAVSGKTFTVKTDAKGVASLAINLKPGSYKVVATNPVTGYQLTNTFKILSTITASDISKIYTDGRRFYATFLTSSGKALTNRNVKFKMDGRTYTAKTNAKGVASLSLANTMPGTHKIISYNVDGLTKANNIKVYRVSTTSLTTIEYIFLKSDTKVVKVRLMNGLGYSAGAGKTISIKINGKTYTARTNANGIAQLKLPTLKEGVYTVIYKFAGDKIYKASSKSNKATILPSKTPTFTVKSTTTFGEGANTPFKVALTSGSIPLPNRVVTLKLNGATYTKTTDKNGVVSLPISLGVGNYTITYTNRAELKVNSKTGSTPITVKQRTPSYIKWGSATTVTQGASVKVQLVDSKGKGISGVTVTLSDNNNRNFSATTASNGYATFAADLDEGSHILSYEYGGDNNNLPCSNSTTIKVVKPTTVSLSNVIAAATNLKNYYDTNGKFPNTITAGGIAFTMPEFLYVMSKAIYQLGNSNYNDITFLSDVGAPVSPSGDNINSKQLNKADYIVVAKNIVNFYNNHKVAPNYATSSVGKIIYSEIIDSFSRILAFYKSHNNRLPEYVVITYPSSGTAQGGTGLNEKNTVKDVSIYLTSTKNCQVGHTTIKNLVNTVTKGLTGNKAKATAIFNYVRDHISYSFYYDTKYGAVGTYTSKKGNCVDHSHLLVAMFRTAGIPARYVHGTCRFSSGNTYGHVWTQVLIDGRWYVADATSSRNSLGSIVNWNTNSFVLKGIYRGIDF